MERLSAIGRERWLVLEPLISKMLLLPPAERTAWLQRLRIHSADVADDIGALLSGRSEVD